MHDSHPHAARAGGILLVAATLLSVLAMAHHPAVRAPDIHGALEQLKSLADLAAWVHGILIGLMLLVFYAFTEYALQRGIERPLVRLGLVFYGAGTVAMIGAAAVSGFVTAKVAGLMPDPTDVDLHVMAQLINYSYALNQAMANIGAVAMSAGILAWGLGLVHDRGWARVVGGIGILAGIAPAIALVVGGLHLDVHGMMLVIIIQAVWNLGVGALLIARKV